MSNNPRMLAKKAGEALKALAVLRVRLTTTLELSLKEHIPEWVFQTHRDIQDRSDKLRSSSGAFSAYRLEDMVRCLRRATKVLENLEYRYMVALSTAEEMERRFQLLLPEQRSSIQSYRDEWMRVRASDGPKPTLRDSFRRFVTRLELAEQVGPERRVRSVLKPQPKKRKRLRRYVGLNEAEQKKGSSRSEGKGKGKGKKKSA